MIDTKVDYGVTSKKGSEPPPRDRQEYLKPDAGQRNTSNSLDLNRDLFNIEKLIRRLTDDESYTETLMGLVKSEDTKTGAYHTIRMMADALTHSDIKPLLEEIYCSRIPRIGLNGHFNKATDVRTLLTHRATKEGAYLVLEILNRIADKKREYPESLY